MVNLVDMGFFDFLKKHKCQNCGRRFNKVENYMHHQLLYHFNTRSFDCLNCGINFADMDKLKDHIRKDHSYKKNK
jgi:DNA-directed RNA polymerase subunit RPC12/RpoP